MSARWIVFGLFSSLVAACSSSPDGSTIGGTGSGTGGGPIFAGGAAGASGGTGEEDEEACVAGIQAAGLTADAAG